MGFMDGARDCQHRWSGVKKHKSQLVKGQPEISYRECSKCQLKVWGGRAKNPPSRGIGT